MIGEELKTRLDNIRKKIKTAAKNGNRKLDDISLIAVSKNHGINKIDFFSRQGIKTFAESRVQELMDKYEQKPDLKWHFIGHLQRNKVKYLMRMEHCQLIHSLDSWRLAKEINKRARKNDRIMPALLEVNIAEDGNKYGISPEAVYDFLQDSKQLKNIKIDGLMTIVPYVSDPEEVRPLFKKMASIREQMIKEGFNLKELSMGMSNDFEVAIEEGSTMVRVGSALFGERRDN